MQPQNVPMMLVFTFLSTTMWAILLLHKFNILKQSRWKKLAQDE